MVKLKLTSIQLYEETKKKLESKKAHTRESYDSVIRRMLEKEKIPSMQDMFRQGDKIGEKKKYSTEEIIKLSHEMRQRG